MTARRILMRDSSFPTMTLLTSRMIRRALPMELISVMKVLLKMQIYFYKKHFIISCFYPAGKGDLSHRFEPQEIFPLCSS